MICSGEATLPPGALANFPLDVPPQHHNWFWVLTAHMCARPIARSATVKDCGMFSTARGVPLTLLSELPIPSCPELFNPQHIKVVSSRDAHEFSPPAKTDCALAGRVTCVGACRMASTELEICPLGFPPQHHTVPSLANTHVCEAPAAIFTATRSPGNASTRTGTVDLPEPTLAAAPNCPEAFEPQHHTVLSLLITHV